MYFRVTEGNEGTIPWEVEDRNSKGGGAAIKLLLREGGQVALGADLSCCETHSPTCSGLMHFLKQGSSGIFLELSLEFTLDDPTFKESA